MQFPEYFVGDDPRDAIKAFLDAVRAFLNELITSRVDPRREPLFRPEFNDDLVLGWNETQGHFDTVIKKLAAARSADFKEHGLDGVVLRLKLRLVRFFHESYRAQGKAVLGKLLSVIDGAVLDSILEMLKASKLISEFKEVMKAALLLD